MVYTPVADRLRARRPAIAEKGITMAALGNVKLRTLRDIAYDRIKESIMTHELMPGEMVAITTLAAKLGISQTPVREAVVRLANEGILNYEANKRIKVSKIEAADVSEIYEARQVLETHIARNMVAAVKHNDALRQQLEALRAETLALMGNDRDAEQYAMVDLKLHELFLDMTDNNVLRELFYIVGNKALRIRLFVEATNKDKAVSGCALRPGAREHLKIIEALLGGRIAPVIEALETHLQNSAQRTLKSLREYFKTV